MESTLRADVLALVSAVLKEDQALIATAPFGETEQVKARVEGRLEIVNALLELGGYLKKGE
jgi:hypothetical protein